MYIPHKKINALDALQSLAHRKKQTEKRKAVMAHQNSDAHRSGQ
jgi:hypothetical protein